MSHIVIADTHALCREALCEFIRQGGKLIDCQVLNSHTASLGAVETPRREYLEHLSRLRQQRLPSHFWVPRTLFSPQG